MNPPTHPYYLGCPGWACDQWRGTLYTTSDPRRRLTEYSQVFPSVEGNTSFYRTPTTETARRWASDTVDGFRFALKFPRTISHDAMLVGAERETAAFLEALAILHEADRLGPSFLQLPPNFSGDMLPELATYLGRLPREFPFAVEFRHADYFAEGQIEREAEALLAELGMDRALFDTRALYAFPPADETEREARRKKMKSIHRASVTGTRPMVRFIGKNDIALLAPWIGEWADVVAGWIKTGLTPYVFTHAPDDARSLEFAVAFHEAVRERLPEIPPLTTFPGRAVAQQQSLFEE